MSREKFTGVSGLFREKSWSERLDESTCRNYVGGVCLGARHLLQEVSEGVHWPSPENRAPRKVEDRGFRDFLCPHEGSLTDMEGSSQANGFLGEFLRFTGFDSLMFV
jgi:hypothetical protein